MKNIKWLLSLAQKKPLIFSLALLLIAVSSLSLVVVNRENKLGDCNEEKKELQQNFQLRVDSLSVYYRDRERQLNEEMKNTLNTIIEEYKVRIEEQKTLYEKVTTTINNNNRIIRNNSNKLKSLQK